MASNRCMNLFSLRRSLDQRYTYTIAFFNSALLPLNLSANALLTITLLRTRGPETREKTMVLCLSLANVLSALLVQPVVTILFAGSYTKWNCLLEFIAHYSHFFFYNATSLIVLGIALNHVIRQTNPLWYKYGITRKKMLSINVFLGVAVLVIFSAHTVASSNGKSAHMNAALSLFASISCVFLLLWLAKTHTEKHQAGSSAGVDLPVKRTQAENFRYRSFNVTTMAILLTLTIVSNVLFAATEVHNAVNGTVVGKTRSSLTEPKNHNKLWPLYVLYFVVIAMPLNGFVSACMLLHLNRTCMWNIFKNMRKTYSKPKDEDI